MLCDLGLRAAGPHGGQPGNGLIRRSISVAMALKRPTTLAPALTFALSRFRSSVEMDDLSLQLHDPLVGRIVLSDRLALAAGLLGTGFTRPARAHRRAVGRWRCR